MSALALRPGTSAPISARLSLVSECLSVVRMSLHDAARNGKVADILRLVSEGSNVNARDNLARTPLHLAAFSGHDAVVSTLLAFGAHAKLCAKSEATALHFAAERGHLQIVKMLVQQGLKPSRPNRKGMTPLHLAAKNGHLDVVKYLLQKKVSIHAKNKGGQTALDLAASEEIRTLMTDFDNDKDVRMKERGGGKPKKRNASELGNEEAAGPSKVVKSELNSKHGDVDLVSGDDQEEGVGKSIGPQLPSELVVQNNGNEKCDEGNGCVVKKSEGVESVSDRVDIGPQLPPEFYAARKS